MKFLFLDTETTGLSEPRLVQLAYHVDGESMYSCGIFKPPKPIELQAQMTHHITEEMVADAPTFQGSPDFERLQTLLNECVLVCHNAMFDIRVLKNEGLTVKHNLCTYLMAKKIYSLDNCHKLQYLRYKQKLNVQAQAHNALGDIMVMEKLFKHMIDSIRQRDGEEAALHFVHNSILTFA